MMEHMEDNLRKRMYTCICDWVTLLYSRKLTEHYKLTIMEKIKIILKKENKKHCGGNIITIIVIVFSMFKKLSKDLGDI